ncbi:AAA family ATPase [Thiothrix nivea]|uniref:Phage DNA transposition protein n=1 Tax=Thiothrix nivea (strain ATCC 35100 / DSM 5205 / JP2) TaxID=870187 RepID=A0A656H9P1_THINJ|nr:AAA family ATPase [Thiothrix nivea]EIJ33338.1 phage DNA transposition protein [Thiothrix nivea DSM 5205]
MTDNTETTAPVRYPLPSEISDQYTEHDKAALASIYDWLNSNPSINKQWLTSTTGLPSGTVASVLSGGYKASPGKQIKVMQEVIARYEDRKAKGIDDDNFAETSVYKLAITVCNRARTYRNFGVLAGYVGTGKTTALKRYAADNSGVILVEADPDMTSSTLLDDIMEQAGIANPGQSINAKFRAILKAFKGTDRLIIVDEAEKTKPAGLEYLRRIRDKAGVGIVLAGTERLHAIIARDHGVFDQIRSRAPFVPPIQRSITREDAAALISNAFPQADEDTIKAFWSLCKGSARMLCEGVIPTVKDYGLGQGHALSAKLVLAVAKQAMSLTPAQEV